MVLPYMYLACMVDEYLELTEMLKIRQRVVGEPLKLVSRDDG